MYFIIDNKLVKCDCNFTNKKEVVAMAVSLLLDEVYSELLIRPVSSRRKKLEFIEQVVLKPELLEDLDKEKYEAFMKIYSKIPFTIAFLAFYMKNNWFEEVIRKLENGVDNRKEYFYTQRRRMN